MAKILPRKGRRYKQLASRDAKRGTRVINVEPYEALKLSYTSQKNFTLGTNEKTSEGLTRASRVP